MATQVDVLDLDPAIVAVLPPGSKIVSMDQHGRTNWSTGFKLQVEVDDDEKEYFLKIIDRPRADEMVLGEYESQKALSTTLPDNIAPVLGHGPLILDPSKAFFLCEFKHLGSRILSPPHLVSILKQLHLSPLSASPTGKFGFTVTTFKGYIPVNNTWCDTWEEFFARQFRAEIEWEQSVRGKDDDLQQLADRLLEVVIPRLLGPLQAGGRTITPVLCHGDLWHGNIELDIETQNPILFDSCCVYGHNEYDLSLMKAPRYRLNADHVDEYKKEIGISEPKEEFDDRLTLYALRNDIVVAGLWTTWSHLREVAKDDMRHLIAKYTGNQSADMHGKLELEEGSIYSKMESFSQEEETTNTVAVKEDDGFQSQAEEVITIAAGIERAATL